MSTGRFVLGLLLLAVTAVPLAAGAVHARTRFVPLFFGARARLVEVLVVLGAYVIVGEILGTVGLFRTGFVVVACVVVGVAAVWTFRDARPRQVARPESDRWTTALAFVAAAVVFAQWCSGAIGSLRSGMVGDTLVYHGPFAARFVQDGWVTRLHFVTPGQVIPFHPATSELLHATGILLFGTDFLSPLLNLGWLALVLLAAWCVGAPRGVGPATLAAVALPLSGRFVAVSQSGTDVNDVVAVAFLLAAVALLLADEDRPGSLVLGGLAAGLAVGTKFTAVVPVVALAAVVLVAPMRLGLWRRVAAWGGPLLVGGSFWYLRNLARVGNPVPSAHVGVGPLSLPSPRLPITQAIGATVAGNLHALGPVAGAALGLCYGRLWFVVLGLALAGAVLAIAFDPSLLRRLLGGAALVCAIGYLFTPTTGEPFYFGVNLRYLLPALVVGLALLPGVPFLLSRWRQRALTSAVLFAVVVNVWPADAWADGRANALAVVAVGVAVIAVAIALRRAPRWAGVGAITVAAVLVAAGGRHVERQYLADRYAHDRTELGRLFAWARSVRNQRIAVAGTPDQYPFYGVDLSNHVDYMGARGPHGEFSSFGACGPYRRALAGGRYRYVVAFPNVKSDPKPPPETGWTKSDPSAREIFTTGRASVFRIDGPVTVDSC